MTQLSEKNVLQWDDSTNKEAARLALGIDLAELTGKIEAKAERNTTENAIAELENRIQTLEEEMEKKVFRSGPLACLRNQKRRPVI